MATLIQKSVPRTALLILCLFIATGCGHKLTRTLVNPDDVRTLDSQSPFLKAHMTDGRVYVLSDWRVDQAEGFIVGNGSLMNANRTEIASGMMTISPDSVTLFETNVRESSGAKTALTVLSGITAAVAGICILSPKTCFGSCPTFYAPGPDGEPRLQAEAFSASIAPGLEATDIDMLFHTRPTSRDYDIRVTNEALETHVIRHATILAAPRPADGRVFVTSDGVFRQASDSSTPIRCEAREGDCLQEVLAADGVERASLADSLDLAAREYIDLEFATVPDGELGLVVVSRQTLLTTFLVYQALAYMGNDAGRWLAALESGGEDALQRASGISRILGKIDVLILNAEGEWIESGSVGETGPIAVDTRVVPLPATENAPLRVRLRLTKGLWRLDQIALVSLGAEVDPLRLPPVRVTRDGEDHPTGLDALLQSEQTLVTLPGDEYTLSYQLPESPSEHEYFLEARGYYLEWMRQEWLVEENPLLAARMVLDPAGALRALAPAFKKEEPQIEHLFWNSRYVKN